MKNKLIFLIWIEWWLCVKSCGMSTVSLQLLKTCDCEPLWSSILLQSQLRWPETTQQRMGSLLEILYQVTREAVTLLVLTLLERCLISHGNFQNFKSFTKAHRGLQDLHPLPPPPQCHVSPTQLLIAGLLKDGGVKEGLGLNKKKRKKLQCPKKGFLS